MARSAGGPCHMAYGAFICLEEAAPFVPIAPPPPTTQPLPKVALWPTWGFIAWINQADPKSNDCVLEEGTS